MSDIGRQVVKTYEKLQAERQPLDKQWEDCYKYTFPELGQGFNGGLALDTVSQGRNADSDKAQLLTSVGAYSVRLLAAAILSSLTPSNVRWFNLGVTGLLEEEASQEVKEWLDDSANLTHAKIHSSNYDAEAIEFAHHLVIAGVGGLFVDWKDDGLHMESWPISHFYLADSLGKGRPDSVYMVQRRTLANLVAEFGVEKLPDGLRQRYSRDPYDEKEEQLIRCIRPRLKGGKQSAGKLRRNLPWESLAVLKDGTVLGEGGHAEFPLIAPRWLRLPGSVYARGPVYSALPDIKSVNEVYRKKHLNADLRLSGAWKAVDDGVINPATVKIGPRMVIPVGQLDNLQRLDVGGDIQFAYQEIQNMEYAIMRMMMADQLAPAEKTIQTAAEVQARANQVRQVLGPIFARLQAEFIAPLVERCFSLCLRNNALPQVPEELAQSVLSVRYTSPLARAQKLNEVDSIDQTLARFANFAQVDQGVYDIVKMDEVALQVATLLGFDPGLLRDPREVKKLRQARAQATQAAAEQAMAAQAATTQPAGPAVEEQTALPLMPGGALPF